MGIGIYSNNSNVKEYIIKNMDGSIAGRIRITKPVKKKTKRLQYNFKQVSSKILKATTVGSAGKALVTARNTIGILQRKLKSGEFDDKEIELAIIHAKKMERIAKKRMKHLQEEEDARQHGSCQENERENGIANPENQADQKTPELNEEELKRLMAELQRRMEETMKEIMKHTGLGELSDELIGTAHKNMNAEDLERLKKKHRSDELKDIVEADMKYLKALFNKLQREKEAVSSSSSGCNEGSVSLEISGVEMPVPAPEPPIMPEGGSIDVTV